MAARKDEQIIIALLECPTIRAAARSADVSEQQIYKRLRDPLFVAQYDKRRYELLDHCTARLQHDLTGAVDCIADIMADSNNAPQVRLNAADIIIKAMIKMTTQTDILRRIEALEASAADINNSDINN